MARQRGKNQLSGEMLFRLAVSLTVTSFCLLAPARAWDLEAHRLINQLALTSAAKELPPFVQTVSNVDRISFLASEPDRWRNVPDLIMKQSGGSWTDHFFDIEYLPEAGIDLETLTSFRLDFVVQFAAGRAANAANFSPIDPAKNRDHTQEWPGFAPWAIAEYFGRLRSAFSYLKVFEELGTPDEVLNAQANVVYLMGVMGHYVGDCSQPLHTTKHYNGWSGDNPKNYTRWSGFHSWVDGFPGRIGLKFSDLALQLRPLQPISLVARPDAREPMFVAVLDYIRKQNGKVEPLYQLEQAKKLGIGGAVIPEETRTFFAERVVEGAEMLATIWLTAFRNAVPDTYLRSSLIKRQTSPATGVKSTP